MPLLWRLLLRNYFRVFFLCMMGFVSVLLITRVQEIARLIALNCAMGKVFLFILFQIPYILPITIPISSLISATLLSQRLSHTHELTAFRSSGINVKTLTTPLLFAAFVLSVANFAITAKITPYSRHLSHNLIQIATTINPLFLMKKSKMLKLQDSYVDMKMTHLGKEAKDVLFAVNNQAKNRLSLMTAKKFVVENNVMTGRYVSIISYTPEEDDFFDSLVIENQETMSTSASALSGILKKPTKRLGIEHLPMTSLVKTFSDANVKAKTVKRAQFELCRRLFFPVITFAFTLLGFSLGMQIGRERKKKSLYFAILLSAFTFICSIAAKSFQLHLQNVIFFYALPIFFLFFASYWFQRRIVGGIE